jgi:hypothetical protein
MLSKILLLYGEMFIFLKRNVETTRVANGGSSNYPPTLVDIVCLSRVVHEGQLKLSTDFGGYCLSVASGTRGAA